MPGTISISSPNDNATVGTTFTASGGYTFSGGGSFTIECYLEGPGSLVGGEEAGEETGGGEEGGIVHHVSVSENPINAEDDSGDEEEVEDTIPANSVSVSTSPNSWSASFTSVPDGTGYTLYAKIKQGSTDLSEAHSDGITVS